MAVADLTLEELAAIQRRLDRVLEAGPLTHYALQYRLCEAGRSRTDSRALRRALAELANNRRPRRGKLDAGPWESIERIYAANDLESAAAESESQLAYADASRLTALKWDHAMDQLKAAIASIPGAVIQPLSEQTGYARQIGGDLAIAGGSQRIRLVLQGGVAASVWVSHDPELIHPDDPRLWQHLQHCHEEGAFPVVVARCIAVPTFALFRRLGVVGLQYYSMLLPQGAPSEIRAALARMRWFHAIEPGGISMHPMIGHLQKAPSRQTMWGSTPVNAAIRRARDIGLGSADSPDSAALLEWALATELSLPKVWVETVTRWVAWSAYSTPSRRARRLIERASSIMDTLAPPTDDGGQSTEPTATETAGPEVMLNDEGEPHTGWGWGRRTKIFKFGRAVLWKP